MGKVVLREEEYLRVLEGILRRDYYPELPPLLTEEEKEFTLEGFQTQYRSEDDASFSALLAKANDERARLYKSKYSNLIEHTAMPLLLSNDNNNYSTSNVSIKPENTRISTMSNSTTKSSISGKRFNFVPMTPSSAITCSPSTRSTITNNSGLLSPAARNLLRSVRKRQPHQPFGGATPSKNNKNDFL